LSSSLTKKKYEPEAVGLSYFCRRCDKRAELSWNTMPALSNLVNRRIAEFVMKRQALFHQPDSAGYEEI
jgi:hypothetical protein